MITIVNRTVLTTATTTGPLTLTIPATTAGNTLLLMTMNPGISAGGAPKLGANTMGHPRGQWGSGASFLTNINGGETTLNWSGGAAIPSAMVAYELSPCLRIEDSGGGTYNPSNGQVNGTPGASEAGVTIIPGTGLNFAYFEVLSQDTVGGSSITAVSSPWVFDYSTSSFLAGAGMGSVVYILNSTGSQTPTWSVTNPSTHVGVSALGFVDSNPTPPGPPSGTGCAVSAGGTYVTDLGLNIAPATELYRSFVQAANINVSEYTTEGRNALVLDFNNGNGLYARDIETAFTWSIQNHLVLRVWQPALIPLPENTFNRAEDWDNGGDAGNKFIQGVTITADTGGLPKTFSLQSGDDLSVHALNEMPATFATQTTKAFSCVQPFVAHSARVISSDGVSWRTFDNHIVYKPWPEQTMFWQTEETSFGLTGWLHAREMNIAYCATAPVTVTLTFDQWPQQVYTLPPTYGQFVQAKTKVTLQANKFKLVSVGVFSSAPMYLFQGDMEFKVKEWGSTELFKVLKVVGGPSDTGAVL